VSRISITEQGDAISRYIEQLYIEDLLAAIDQIPDEKLDDLAESIAMLDQIADTLEQRRLNRTRRGKTVPVADCPRILARIPTSLVQYPRVTHGGRACSLLLDIETGGGGDPGWSY
jgi:hypothetical protein